jgi:hypothetical protein
MSWWQVLLLCWFCYFGGFFTAALMAVARDNQRFDDQLDDVKAGLTDD